MFLKGALLNQHFFFLSACTISLTRVIFRVWHENNYGVLSKGSVIKARAASCLAALSCLQVMIRNLILVRFLDLPQGSQLFLSWSLRIDAEIIFTVSFWISVICLWPEIKNHIIEIQVFPSPKCLPVLAATFVPCTKSDPDLTLKMNQSFSFFLILHCYPVLPFLILASRARCLALIKSIL